MKIKHYTIPVFIPELACPFQCVFCDQKKISGYSSIPSENEVRETIEAYLKSFRCKEAVINIGFFGGNFTGIPIEQQRSYLSIASEYLQSGKIHGIRLSTRPDYIDEERIEMLKRYSVTTVELGAQSLDDSVLIKTGRGHRAQHVINASELIRSAGISLGLQMMIGLPGDTPDKAIATAKKIIELGADNTRIYPTLIIKGTTLEDLYNKEKYTPLSMEDAIDLTKQLLLLFEKNKVNVIRIGLHPSEGLLHGHELAAGPFHMSFKELVLTSIWKDLLTEGINRIGKEITIRTSPEQLSYAIGYQAANREMLHQTFHDVHFIPDDRLVDRDFNVIYN